MSQLNRITQDADMIGGKTASGALRVTVAMIVGEMGVVPSKGSSLTPFGSAIFYRCTSGTYCPHRNKCILNAQTPCQQNSPVYANAWPSLSRSKRTEQRSWNWRIVIAPS